MRPPNEESPSGQGRGFQETKQNTDAATVAPAEKIGNSDKTIATLIAQFALAGHVVHKGECGDFTVTRWGLTRYCQDLDALQAFAKQVGA